MELTLDYNVELFPLQKDQNFALALASSLGRGGTSGNVAEASQDETNENERDVWRPDGKGSRGLEDEYDYVMYGKVRLQGAYHGSWTYSPQDLQV
jgi:DNA-directed RNA polymerase I, II, and III subunit RPABC3